MTPTTLAEALRLAVHAQLCGGVKHRSHFTGECRPHVIERMTTALLALPPDRRAAIAAELLDEDLLAVALDFANKRLTVHEQAAAILAALKGA